MTGSLLATVCSLLTSARGSDNGLEQEEVH
jgi:hypothetical protein